MRRHQQLLPKGIGKEAAVLRAAKLFSRALAGDDLRPVVTPKAEPEVATPVAAARTVGDALDAHLEWAAAYRQRTLADREYLANVIARHFGRGTPLAELDVSRLQAFVRARQKERTRRGGKVQPATINRALAFLRLVARQEVEAERVPAEVAQRICRVKLLDEPDGRVRYLREGEEARLRDALPLHLRTVMDTLLRTGMRLGEVAKLRKDDVDLDRGALVVRHTKSNRDRVLPIGPALVEVLRDAIDRSKCDVVFPTPAGRQYTIDGISRAFARAIAAAEIRDLHAHDLRHTAATRMARKFPLQVVQRMLGHAEITTTSRYAHAQDDQLREAAQYLDALER